MKPSVVFLAMAMTASIAAQSPASLPESVSPAAIPLGTRVGDLASGYDDGGRRDPFGSLVVPKKAAANAPEATGRPRSGLAGLALADVTVRGIVKSGTTMFAILEAPGKQSFTARLNDRLLDGDVKSIDTTGVVFAEHGSTGASGQVRKPLRLAGEEVR